MATIDEHCVNWKWQTEWNGKRSSTLIFMCVLSNCTSEKHVIATKGTIEAKTKKKIFWSSSQ